MRTATGASILIAAAVLQVTLAPHLTVAGVFPNLVLISVAGWTLVGGARGGIRWAIAGGLLLDLLSPGPLGLHALALAAAAYAAGFLQRSYEADPVVLPATAGALAALIYNLVLLGAAELVGSHELLGAVASHWVLPATLYDALLTPPAALLLLHLNHRWPARQPI